MAGGSIQWRGENTRESSEYGRTVTFGKRKDECTGYLSHSDRVGPGVILLHEFFGLQQTFKDYADALTREGFTVLAPDLYDGRIASSVDEAKEISGSLDDEQVGARLEAARSFLADNWHPRVGIVGFSMGAWLGMDFAAGRDIEAVVTYYGYAPVDPKTFGAPAMLHLAESDEWEPLEEVQAAFEGWPEEAPELEIHVYPGTGHWFANPAVPAAFDEGATELAWSRTVDFLRHHLA
jgi:carboxymethylenebutenolidase